MKEQQRHPLVAGLLGLIGNMLARNAAVQAVHGRSGRVRAPGKARPAGSKLARKASELRLTVRHFGSFGVINTAR